MIVALKDFNPRSHERSDADRRKKAHGYVIFQSTLPREERRWQTRQGEDCRNFNPRSHERSDRVADQTRRRLSKFQSTLPREERRRLSAKAIFTKTISIHAPTRGATFKEQKALEMANISIHAPTRGATAILHKKFVYFYTIPTINI